jgi:acyl-CoA synthetase (AMP-forming)/AMP-acid ligase II
MSVNIADTLKTVAATQGTEVGVIEARSGRQITFAELDRTADQYAAYFAEEGVKPGERVMLMVRPSAEFISLAFALFRLGSPVILIDPGMGYRNLLRCIENVKPDHLISIPAGVLFSLVFKKVFSSLKRRFCCGSPLGLTRYDIRHKIATSRHPVDSFKPDQKSLAAIIFTTGSTGPPKGVRFEHAIFAAQLALIQDYYRIGPGDVDQPGFPLFALFSAAMGACSVIPDMDPSRPAQVDPARFIASIETYKVSYSFGSPAIWNVVSTYCIEHDIRCHSLKKVLMAGAPVSGELIERVYRIMPQDGEIFTPYGATESLPIVSIEGREILNETWDRTNNGEGTCVGRPLPGIDVKIIESTDEPIEKLDQARELPPQRKGEIIVKGDVVTRAYENNPSENKLSKITEHGACWHRIGDIGYFDETGRLWFCGRKAHRVMTRDGVMYTIPCEAIINAHPDVLRSALVGVDQDDGYEKPALILEKLTGAAIPDEQLIAEVRLLAERHGLTRGIEDYYIHPGFPVDIRHNAKIFREKLKIWVQQKVG